jgi:cyanophycinase-like exopeptidase
MSKSPIFVLIALFFCTINANAQTGYTSYFTGDTTDVTTVTQGGSVLMGGSTESDDAMRWFLNRSGGGDIVVIRTSGSNGYNDYFFSQLGTTVNSVQTIVFTSATAASDPYVLRQLRNAEAVWIAGGDQAVYTNYWRNSPVETILNNLINVKHVPFGGTSAGCAILGNSYFAALNGGLLTSEILADPYNTFVTLASNDFLQIPYLENVITDQHFSQRGRQGRLLGFMARIKKDENREIRVIAADEKTAVCIDENGLARVFCVGTATGNAFFGQFNCAIANTQPETCVAGQPLAFGTVGNEKVIVAQIAGNAAGSNTFDLNTWRNTAAATQWQAWAANNNQYFINAIPSFPTCLVATEAKNTENTQFSIYPNPNNGNFTVETTEIGTLDCFDALGKLIFTQKIDKNTNFSMENVVSGVYLLRLSSEKGVGSGVFVKE